MDRTSKLSGYLYIKYHCDSHRFVLKLYYAVFRAAAADGSEQMTRLFMQTVRSSFTMLSPPLPSWPENIILLLFQH